ncbi:MAG: ABC transporter permease [Candidatus Omnitrophica bacterium]|nr:ABC transporter permease [Candidatus Omnitrophota bacterium]
MKTYLWIALKYFLNSNRKRFFSVMTLVSVLGVAIGVMTLIVVLGVMSGFDKDLKSKILGLNYNITIDSNIGISAADSVFEKIDSLDEVSGYSPFVSGQVLLATYDRFRGVHIRGIDLVKEAGLNNIASYIKVNPPRIQEGELLVGEELLKGMDLALGDEVVVLSPITNKRYPFRIGGIFKSGYYDYDLNLVFANIKDTQELLLMDGFYSGIGINSQDIHKTSALKEKFKDILGPAYSVRTWIELNRNFFAALKLEKITMFIILTLIVLVAAFNIISTLNVFVTDKTKDIGILKSIGLSSKGINRIFMLVGIFVGSLGIVSGLGLGVGLCMLLSKYQFIRLPQDIYYIQYLPVYLKLTEVATIVLAAFLICLVSTLYPARRAASLEPVEALRYE